MTQADYLEAKKTLRLRDPLPWYLDNGPLTPGGFGLEFPQKFDPIEADPVGTDIYITKAQKYPWPEAAETRHHALRAARPAPSHQPDRVTF